MFVVIEGLDRAGKATQLKRLFTKTLGKKIAMGRAVQTVLGMEKIVESAAQELAGETLVDKLAPVISKQEIGVFTISFPQYEDTYWGKFIGQALRGDYGDFSKVNPYFASLPYALDRQKAAPKIRRALRRGDLVIADRYTTSNILYQGAKFETDKEFWAYVDWLEHLEYKVLRIPKPDIVFFLDVSPEITTKRVEAYLDSKKNYLKGKKDIHEENLTLQERAYAVALKLARKRPNYFVRIECVTSTGELLPIEEITQKLLQYIEI